ncbi:MAG: hypothetical protein COA78_19025 [Blastopirellula sp.]|nr:MAG: hypothetical protein COA78_19025 [Blastopirellula sp.]
MVNLNSSKLLLLCSLLVVFFLPVTVVGEEEAKKAERDEKALPQVLVIGDDVYNEPTRIAAGLLQGRVQLVYGKHAIYNSSAALEDFDKLLDSKKWDLIHFNFGFNDLMHKDPATQAIRAMHKDAGGVRVTSPQQYEKNLRELVKRFRAHGAKVIWASTTPIVGSDGILMEGSEVAYNQIAAKVMQEHNVTINDMHAHAAEIHKTAKHKNTYSYKGYPLYPPMMRSILKELDLMRPVKGPVKVFVMVGGWTHIGDGIVVGSNKPRTGRNARRSRAQSENCRCPYSSARQKRELDDSTRRLDPVRPARPQGRYTWGRLRGATESAVSARSWLWGIFLATTLTSRCALLKRRWVRPRSPKTFGLPAAAPLVSPTRCSYSRSKTRWPTCRIISRTTPTSQSTKSPD